MSTNELTTKIRELRELQALIDEAEQEAEAIRDTIKAHMGDSEELRAGEYSAIQGFRRSNLFSLLVSGYTYLMAIIMVLITPITYFKRKGNVEKKFLWLFVSCISFYLAWFMFTISTYF